MIRIYTLEYTLCEGQNKRAGEHESGIRLLRHALSREYGIREFSVGTDKYGKPCLNSHPEIYFNISHSRGMAACAVGHVPLGIDVERIRPFRPSLAKRVLGEEERRDLENCGGDPEESANRFIRLWTLKESYAKADGRGLRIPMDEIRFSFLPGGKILCSRDGCGFWQSRLSEKYWLSLCWLGDGFEEQVEMADGRWEE